MDKYFFVYLTYIFFLENIKNKHYTKSKQKMLLIQRELMVFNKLLYNCYTYDWDNIYVTEN